MNDNQSTTQLSQSNDNKVPVVPEMQMQDMPTIKFGNSAQAQPVMFSPSPESGPVIIENKPDTAAVEAQTEALRPVENKVEFSPENVENIEKKEAKPLVSDTPQVAPTVNATQPAPAQKEEVVEEKKLELPPFKGYEIPEEMINLEQIAANKDKKDKNLADTAIWLFLDRLLKKGNEK